jgi:hypothetical protein
MHSTTHIAQPNELATAQPAPLRAVANILSYVFHPLFIPTYVAAFLIYIHPSCFAGTAPDEKARSLTLIAINTIMFPGITVLLLKGLKFIDSIFLRTQKDRIIPYIASGTYYFWAFWVLKNQAYPPLMIGFMLGVFICTYAALLVNIYSKISMHAIGMGGMLGLFLIIMRSNTMLMTWPLAAALLIAGLVCTARLLVSNHRPSEIYSGLLLGIACQLIASFFV